MHSLSRAASSTRRIAAATSLALLVALAGSASLPERADASPTISLDVSWTRPTDSVPTVYRPPAQLRVGDTLTVSVQTEGYYRASCTMMATPPGSAGSLPFTGSITAEQSEVSIEESGYCLPWTFVVPPAPAGVVRIEATALGSLTYEGIENRVPVGPVVREIQLVTGGTARPYTSNYPTPSWALVDVIGSATPNLNAALAFAPPPGSTDDLSSCRYGLWIAAVWFDWTRSGTACAQGWDVAIPDVRGGPYGGLAPTPIAGRYRVEASARAPLLDPWAFLSGSADREFTFGGEGASAFSSNQAAVVLPEASHPRYVHVGSTVTIRPLLQSVPDGWTCAIEVGLPNMNTAEEEPLGTESTVTGNSCAPFSFSSPDHGIITVTVRVFRRLDGLSREWTDTWIRMEAVPPMPAPALIVPSTMLVGQATSVSGAVSDGAPAAYQFSSAQTGSVSGLSAQSTNETTATTSVCGAGAMNLDTDQRTASARCTAPTLGTYNVTVAFTDPTGVRVTRTRAVTAVMRTLFVAGTHTGYTFGSNGAVTASRTGTLSASSSASMAERRAIAGREGMWLRMVSGTWSGYWMRESPSTHLAGVVGRENYATARRVTLAPRSHTGYTFSSGGQVVSSKSATLSAYTSATASARAIINGKPYLLIASGTFAGYWLPESGAVYLPGYLQQVTFGSARTVTLAATSHTGYQYATTGAVSSSKTAKIGSAARVSASAWAIINGRPHARVSSGTWNGYWLPLSSSVVLNP